MDGKLTNCRGQRLLIERWDGGTGGSKYIFFLYYVDQIYESYHSHTHPFRTPILPTCASLEKEVDPKTKASSIIDALPGNSLISKTGFVTLGTGLAVFLISKEIYILNEETLVLLSVGGLFALLFKYLRDPYNAMADETINVS